MAELVTTIWPHRLVVRSTPFQGVGRVSNTRGATFENNAPVAKW
jgi:hypothetical protein